MQHQNLNDLIFSSASSRKFFFSQSVSMQLALAKHGENIRSAADLHRRVYEIAAYERAVKISELPLFPRQ